MWGKMNCVAVLLIMIASLISAVKADKSLSSPNLQMTIPTYLLKNHDMHGQCTSNGIFWPKIYMDNKDKCDFTIEQRRRIVKQGTNKLFCTEFVVKNVTATCEYHCAFSNARVTKTVVVKDAKILHSPFNITAIEGMPVKLECIVATNTPLEHYKLIWMKGDVFLSGNGYTIESEQLDDSRETQIHKHYLTIHQASPGAYSCLLISANMRVIDVKTQHVVTESTGDSVKESKLKEFIQFFKWN